MVVLENTLPSTSQLFIVLKKGAVYSLVAVSMNLLNGFTGLFSLGQAGFMLLGAYTYAILTVPMAQKDTVYYLYGGSAVKFSLPDLFGGAGRAVSLMLGVLLAILLAGWWPPSSPGSSACRCCGSRATIWPLPPWASPRSSGPSSSGRPWARSPTAPT